MVLSVLVTGAGRGIGLATAQAFHDAGWRVLATARRDNDLKAFEARGWAPIRLDVADAQSTAEAAEAALREGPPAVLVNNAGYAELGPVEAVDRDAWRRQFETNVFGPFDLARRLAPAMRKAGGGRILQVSSVLGRFSVPYSGVYAASKHAMEAATDAMRVELRPWGIHVGLVEPGPVGTDFTPSALKGLETRVPASSPYDYSRRVAVPLAERFRKGTTPERVARVILHEATRARPRARRVVGLAGHLGVAGMGLLPRGLVDAAAAWALRPPKHG